MANSDNERPVHVDLAAPCGVPGDNRVVMIRCVIAVPRHATLSSVALAADLLGVAAVTAGGPPGPHSTVIASVDGGDVQFGTATLRATSVLARTTECDVIWVAGFWGTPARGIDDNAELVAWLTARHEQGSLIAGHGPAAFLLAEAGLLDGRLATAFISQAAEFARRFPAVDLQPSRLITDAGGVFCCVGMNSAADLLVMLIERTFGRQVARSVAQWALSDSRRNYETGMTAFGGQKYHGDSDIAKVQGYLEQHFTEPLALRDVARTFGMSARTLTRRFKAATGERPRDYLGRLRVEAAKDLLRETQLSIAEISSRVGYRDAGALYSMFAKHDGTRPSDYRPITRLPPGP
ncbi:transcriptional regulator [Mycobacterium saskatchewanense]|uniref:Transcriptional regulator n=1 Tax=Mycobacterium saskatchewanense TaxID=220927 RepID=A0A1X2CAS6_9MYCO|nr:helix-turn-helix domain-containing protein [Mycobacterium saskatchewanense]ORW72921.1 hypothetical protein AWC23_08680 [Mycobacterium saskatchewanense]BBX62551.1 transcriptional regulator [Mycobacterium saskatchewanense]